MSKGLLDIELLHRYAKDYDKALRFLPYFKFQEFAAKMRLNVVEVDNEDVLTHYRRKAGNTGAYKAGSVINYPKELGKIVEMSLKTELTVSRIKDNITNYGGDKKIISNAGESVDNVTKKHPLEKLYVDGIITSHAEDIIFSTFFASRDESSFSPSTAFTGFFPTIDALKINNDINQASRNLVPTGAFGSGDGVNDYDRLVTFIRQAHPVLKRDAILYYSDAIELVCLEALRLKTNSFSRPTSVEFWNSVKADSKCPSLQPITHEAYGSGQALIMIKPGMLDMGVNTMKAARFVQIRAIYEDPNEIQMWLQAAYGTRIQDVHQKVFQINEFTNESVDLAGDYVKGAALSVQVEPVNVAGGWRISGDTDWMACGKTKLGVDEGSVTIEFKDVEGFTKPANQTIVVKEGLDYSAEGVYVAK